MPTSRARVYYESHQHIGSIVLNDADNRNSMTPELLSAFAEAVAISRRDTEARVIVIRGEGGSFSAGADFRSEVQGGGALPSERSFSMYRPFLSLLDVEVPVIAAMNGHAVGGGFGLSLVCDMRVANEDAKYGANFAKLGLHPGMAITYLLPRLIGLPRASELLFTGRLLSGREALAMGLVNDAVPRENVLARAMELAEGIASSAPLVVRSIKRALREGLAWQPVAAARGEAALQAESLTTDDCKEGIAALLEKRSPNFRGH